MKIENWLFATQILRKYQNLWNVSIKIGEFFFKDSLFLKLNFAQVKDKTPKFYVNFMIGVAAILKILQARWKKVDLCSVSLFKRK